MWRWPKRTKIINSTEPASHYIEYGQVINATFPLFFPLSSTEKANKQTFHLHVVFSCQSTDTTNTRKHLCLSSSSFSPSSLPSSSSSASYVISSISFYQFLFSTTAGFCSMLNINLYVHQNANQSFGCNFF